MARSPDARPLDFALHETRFLLIEETKTRPCLSCGTSEAAIRVSRTLKIESLLDKPEYVTLSYSWGNHHDRRPIELDGHDYEVTLGLADALAELQASGVKRAWIDALCLYQDNEYENVCHLRQMGLIFGQAAKVVAWLGPAADDSDAAMQALSSLGNDLDVDRHGVVIIALLKRPIGNEFGSFKSFPKHGVMKSGAAHRSHAGIPSSKAFKNGVPLASYAPTTLNLLS